MADEEKDVSGQDGEEKAAKKPAAKKAPAAKKEPAEKAASQEKNPAVAAKDESEQSKDQPTSEQPVGEKRPAEAKADSAKAEKPAASKKAPSKKPAAKEPAAEKPAKGAASTQQQRRVVRAHARYVRTSARKARLVCVQLPGKSVAEARAILAFTPRSVARDWSKLLESAVANAENNHELLEDDLIVREAFADEGPTIKRFRPRAMGRATPIRKRTSHLTITLTPGK
jgi:ribosomal protein L22